MALPEAVERRKGIIAKWINSEAGKAAMDMLMNDFVNRDLMGSTDRETIENVAKHDLVIYLKAERDRGANGNPHCLI